MPGAVYLSPGVFYFRIGNNKLENWKTQDINNIYTKLYLVILGRDGDQMNKPRIKQKKKENKVLKFALLVIILVCIALVLTVVFSEVYKMQLSSLIGAGGDQAHNAMNGTAKTVVTINYIKN